MSVSARNVSKAQIREPSFNKRGQRVEAGNEVAQYSATGNAGSQNKREAGLTVLKSTSKSKWT